MRREEQTQAALDAALAENKRLRAEIEQLKDALAGHPSPTSEAASSDSGAIPCLPSASGIDEVTAPADKAAKVALFRSLFRGREDVYAERWRMKDGNWGYRPAGRKNWEAVLASEPGNRKKVDRQTRILYPLTDEVIRLHLSGKKTVGIYPLLLDETCWLLAADFDKATWQEDALAFVATSKRSGLSAYLERSRSGNGGHVWIFFGFVSEKCKRRSAPLDPWSCALARFLQVGGGRGKRCSPQRIAETSPTALFLWRMVLASP